MFLRHIFYQGLRQELVISVEYMLAGPPLRVAYGSRKPQSMRTFLRLSLIYRYCTDACFLVRYGMIQAFEKIAAVGNFKCLTYCR